MTSRFNSQSNEPPSPASPSQDGPKKSWTTPTVLLASAGQSEHQFAPSPSEAYNTIAFGPS